MDYTCRVKLLAAAIPVFLAAAGCGKKKEQEEAEIINHDQMHEIAVVPGTGKGVQSRSLQAGVQKAAREFDQVTMYWEPPAAGDRKSQIAKVAELVARQVDGILLSPVDNVALVRPVSEARKAGIPVVIMDAELEGEEYVGFVGTDHHASGTMAALEMGKLMNGQGNTLVMKCRENTPYTSGRTAGFLETLGKEFPEITVLSHDQSAGPTAEQAFAVSENLLIMFPQVTAVFCPDQTTTAGMLRALKDIDRQGKIVLVGITHGESLTLALGEGEISALLTQNYLKIGSLAVRAMMSYLSGDSVERVVSVEPELITRENIHDPDKQALLNPVLLD